MKYMNDQAKVKYGPVFDALLPFMPEIIASYSQMARSSISSGIGEYAIKRTNNGVDQIFLLYFLQDARGVWQIDGM